MSHKSFRIFYFFFHIFFFIIDSYFLIPSVIAQIFIPAAEPVMSTGTQTNEESAEIQTQPVTVETKIRKSST